MSTAAAVSKSRAAVLAVALAGEKLGYWTRTGGRQEEGNDSWLWVEVTAPTGGRFTLTGGGWNAQGRVGCRLAGLPGPHGLAVPVENVRRLGADAAPEAYASADRPPETIAKDFKRRVVDLPWAHELVKRQHEALATMTAQRDALEAHVEALKGLGYEFSRYAPHDTYKADGYMRKPDTGLPRNITVTSDGQVAVSVAVKVPDLARLKGIVVAA